MKIFTYIALFVTLISCQQKKEIKKESNSLSIPKYAKGFVYEVKEKYIKVTVKTPFKGATTPYEYIIIKGDTIIEANSQYQVIVKTPIQKIVATSTTQIPILESLNTETLLKGYPNTDFISSKKTRTLIEQGAITDIGHEENMNVEMVLDINPDVLFAFAVNSINKNFRTLKKAGIPIVIDASWLEETPLGRAEWIKFFALFLGKEKEAEIVFNSIEKSYQTALKALPKNTLPPTVLYGGMYNDIWYTPAGDSFMAQILKDAQVNYLWKNTKGTGSLSLPFENVFIKGQNTNFWFAPGAATTKQLLSQKNKHYTQFLPYKTNNIYTYSNTIGSTGGMLFFELGALRPDMILKDIIKICHPGSLTDYETTFFKKLD